MESSLTIIDCVYCIPVGGEGHLFCACPKVHAAGTHNFITTDRRGKMCPPVRCQSCKYREPKTGANPKYPLRIIPEGFIAPQLDRTKVESVEWLGLDVNKKYPGNELKKLLTELGFNESMGCGCKSMITRMNILGPQGCREQIESIEAKLNESKKLVSWWDLGGAFANAVRLGLPKTVRGLILEAITRAEN